MRYIRVAAKILYRLVSTSLCLYRLKSKIHEANPLNVDRLTWTSRVCTCRLRSDGESHDFWY